MQFLAGEWVLAWIGLSATLLVAALGVAGLGWWVVRGENLNRKAEESLDTGEPAEHH